LYHEAFEHIPRVRAFADSIGEELVFMHQYNLQLNPIEGVLLP